LNRFDSLLGAPHATGQGFRKGDIHPVSPDSRLVDATTLTLLATVVQTVVITLTLLIFIFQFRSQERAIRESSYQNLLGRYNELMLSGTKEDDLLFARLFSENKEVGPEDLSMIRRLLLSYGIIEEAFELYKKGWIDGESWEQWNTWLKALSRTKHFARLHSATAGMYDKDFQDHVSRLLNSGGASPV
jgi:hypothetical protein